MKTKAKVLASLKIWVVIYPALTFFLYVFTEHLSRMPLYLRTLLMTGTLVPLVVFAGVPLVDFIIRQFFPNPTSK
jgi:antibiotic biosynthesis monooxygenase (ABM) superfamily enzyme